MLGTPLHVWALFAAFILLLLGLDIGVFHRRAHRIGLREALLESAGWISVALLFNLWIFHWRGPEAALQYLTAYLVEKSLSVDNIFVFLLIFQSFRIPAESQHKVLYFGVLGALVMRMLFVAAGIELLRAFHPVLYIFGAILLITGIRMVRPARMEVSAEHNWIVRLATRILPVTSEFEGDRFLVKRNGIWLATPLFLALLAVESMDLIFAVDSVPAVLAITRDAFIAYSSNAFAILGLRALYFALAGLLSRFRFLHQGLGAMLMFVGIKMLASDRLKIPDGASLAVVAGILALTVAASLLWPRTN